MAHWSSLLLLLLMSSIYCLLRTALVATTFANSGRVINCVDYTNCCWLGQDRVCKATTRSD